MGKATEKINKKEILVALTNRYNPSFDEGLTTLQVEERKKAKLVNKRASSSVKSPLIIIWHNFFSFFNVLLYTIGIALIIVQEYSSLFFLIILAFNIGIGTYQDFRARKTLMRLLILNAHQATVIRNGKEQHINSNELVLDDVVKLKMGDQILADGLLIKGTVGVNESLLTGEPDIIHKEVDDVVLSGSFVTTGTAYYRVDKVGKLGYAQSIQLRARAFKRPQSELLSSIHRLFRVIGIFVIVIGALLVFASFYQGNDSINSVKSIAGSLVGMIPSGMYLLTSMTLAVGVVRLGQKDTLVNEMYSIEMLARIDVLCLDKTGTITDGTMSVNETILLPGHDDKNIDVIIASLLQATEDENPTANALRKHFNAQKLLPWSDVLPFTSDNKYSGAVISGKSYIIGATNMVLSKEDAKRLFPLEESYLKRGLRTLIVAESTNKIVNKQKPANLEPLALIVIQDTIRKEAISAIKWFKDNGVKVKVISGDDPISVSEIARQVGIEEAHNFVDLSKENIDLILHGEEATVYGRVKPNQKETIIRSLQEKGHTVAMIGDGVNDVLALKSADCSIAMGKGSGAARGASHLALLEDNFDALPAIVDEGRRAINNLQKTWALFLVKTTFAIILSIMFLLAALLGPAGAHIRYPLEPRNMYIWEILSLGVPSFFLSLQPNRNKIKGTFLDNVMRRSLPAGAIIVTAVFILYLMRNFCIVNPGTLLISEAGIQAMVIITFTFLSFVVLLRNSMPFNKYRRILFVLVGSGAIVVMVVLHFLNVYFGIDILGADYRSLNYVNVIQLVLLNTLATVAYIYVDYLLVPKAKRSE